MKAEVITFHGADHKCGTSMLAQCTAEQLAQERPDLRVLLVHTEPSCGDDYSPMLNESIARIGPYITDRIIDTDEILDRSKVRDNLWMIGGVGDVCAAASFHPDMTIYFINSIRQSFDVIICDSGSEINSGIALGALLCADKVFMVLSQSGNALARYKRFALLYDRLGLTIDKYIVNRYDRSAVFDRKSICEKLGIPEDSVITVRVSGYSQRAELDSKSLLNYRDNAFVRDIDRIRSEITGDGKL